MKLEVTLFDAPTGWDEALLSLPMRGCYEQSSHWARIAQAIGRGAPIYLRVQGEGRTIASLLCFEGKPWDAFQNLPNRKASVRLSGQMKGTLAWHWGPSFFSDDLDQQKEACRLLLDWVDDYAKGKRLYEIRGYLSDQNESANNEAFSALFWDRAYQRKLWATFLVDLSPDEEDLWRQLKASARKAVNKARRAGMSVREIEREADFEKLWLAKYRAFEMSAGRKVYSKEWFRAFWKHGGGATHRYFVALDAEDQVMAVLGMNVFNGTAREFNSAINTATYSRGLPAQDLLHWEMLLAAKQSGCTLFNLSGVDPYPEDKKAIGIRQFKAKWGGAYLEYPRFIKPLGWGFGGIRW